MRIRPRKFRRVSAVWLGEVYICMAISFRIDVLEPPAQGMTCGAAFFERRSAVSTSFAAQNVLGFGRCERASAHDSGAGRSL